MGSADRSQSRSGKSIQGELRADDLRALAAFFGLGRIRSLRSLDRGSTFHRKSILRTDCGEYFLKYRIGKSADKSRIEEVHRVHQHLHRAGFPVPPLLTAPGSERTIFERGGAVYELTQFIHGESDDRSPVSARSAGRMLARFHHGVSVMKPPGNCEVLSRPYHCEMEAVSQLATAACRAIKRSALTLPADELDSLIDKILSQYRSASSRAEERGYFRWPRLIVHGDWHPGNLLFRRDGEVSAVLDLNSMRFEPRIADVANGLLQFSMQGGSGDPDDWPTEPDEAHLSAFCEGYDEFSQSFMLSSPEIRAIPYLMAEALIAECLAPIAATGAFLNIPGDIFLRMVGRKTDWLMNNANRFPSLLGE